jgi:hypothetical protein
LKDGNFSSVTSDTDGNNWTKDKTISVACKSAIDCFDINASSSDGTLGIKDGGSGKKCEEAHNIAHNNEASSKDGVTHQF